MVELAPVGAREMRAIFETAAQGNLDDRYARATVSQQHTRALEPMLPDERRRRAARLCGDPVQLSHGHIEMIRDALRGQIGMLSVGFDIVRDLARADRPGLDTA